MYGKNKYVKLQEFGSIIIFPCHINHSEFRNWNVVSAGFCYVRQDKKRVDCFGESIGLGLKADVREDTIKATAQIFGTEAMVDAIDNLTKSNKKTSTKEVFTPIVKYCNCAKRENFTCDVACDNDCKFLKYEKI